MYVKKFMLSFKRMSCQLSQLRFYFDNARDLSSIMVGVVLLSICVFVSLLPSHSSTYLPAYLGYSFICDISNSVSLTVDCALNNDVQRISRSGGVHDLWDGTVLLQVALKEHGVFCFGNAAAVLVLMMIIRCVSQMRTSGKRT
jgi:hypothetical protein